MGLGGKFLQLMQGLILGGSIKIHINGQFSTKIPLSRGVRQGCPLTPMLFAICTQPLLAYIQEERSQGRIMGLQLSLTLQVRERLFADDVSIFIPVLEASFLEVKNCVRLYEQAFGAKLNLHKSSVLPISLTAIPQWLHDKGCTIFNIGEISRYLGAPIGSSVLNHQLIDYCLSNVGKRISLWKDKHLSFVGRVILIRRILTAILVYHMMYTYFSKSAALKLQRLCKDFLWGFSKNGARKVPLIAWE